MPLIQIKGGAVLIDEQDVHLLYSKTGKIRGAVNPSGYAIRAHGALHRLIMGAKPGQVVDHINQNKLDNRRANLRIASHQINAVNTDWRTKRKTSSYIGVTKRKVGWEAQASGGYKNRTVKYLGKFRSETEAAYAYDAYARSKYGEQALVNFTYP